MTDPYKMPPLHVPFVDGDGKITQPWSGLLRDYLIGLKAEKAPKRVAPFYLSLAEQNDPANFVQAGATAGLGCGDYLGWAKCNGNNGTPTPGDTVLRFMLGADAGTTGGSDSNVHAHSVDVPGHGHGDTFSVDDHALVVTEIPGHEHEVRSATNNYEVGVGEVSGGAGTDSYIRNNTTDKLKATATGGGLPHGHGLSGAVSNTDIAAFNSADAGSATGNLPAYFSWVPLMRV